MATISSGWGPKPSGRLADYMNASKGTMLLGDIQAHMIREADKPSTRRQDVIHPSEMAKTGWCPRSTYYRIKACREADNPYLKPTEYVGAQLLNIFDEGHHIHDKWQRRLWYMGRLAGQWTCMLCGGKFNAVSPENCVRDRCAADRAFLKYSEVGLRVDEYLIAGHADGAIPDLQSLIEIKSVGAGTVRIEAPNIYNTNTEGQKIDLQGLWRDIKEPFPAHIRQGQLYLALCDILKLPYNKIIFIYEAKFNQGVKEFVVKYDPAVGSALLSQAAEIVSALNANGFIPECPTGTCKDCEQYGTETNGHSERMGIKPSEGTKSPRTTIRRSSGSTARIVRP